MSSEELSGDCSDSGPESLNFEDENPKSSQIPGKQKCTDRNYMSWTFHDAIQADVLADQFEERLSTSELEQLPVGHFVSGPSQSLRI